MKLLLINPNRYRTPPVPPLALEYLENALRFSRHECRVLDLCFADDPLEAIDSEIDSFSPDIAGITVRNIDTVIYDNNVFFLDDMKPLVKRIKENGILVVIGGSGFSFSPKGVLEYLGGDWGVTGPGEKALVHILDCCETEPPSTGTIFDGREFGFDPDMPVMRGDSIKYGQYIDEGGLAGFETQKGCMERCFYCSEGSSAVVFRNPERIVEELKTLTHRGITGFHLCDTEFNQDLDFCHTFLEMLIAKGPVISWAVYMKSSPYDDELFRLLKKSGANFVTLSIPTGSNSLEHAGKICWLAKKYNIKLAVDLLLGFPGETAESVKRTIDYMRKIRPDTIGVNTTFRLYTEMGMTREILASPRYSENLTGSVKDNPGLVRPVFYNHITVDTLREIIGDDPLFRIEGFERTSNYQRVKTKK
jgi:radical SAM superfamily enzyme YgiQ (UPF0313 family)